MKQQIDFDGIFAISLRRGGFVEVDPVKHLTRAQLRDKIEKVAVQRGFLFRSLIIMGSVLIEVKIQ